MKTTIENFADYYIEQGFTDFDAFALADMIADARPDLTRMELCNLVNACETVIKEKTGYVCPFAGLTDAPNAWEPK